MYKITCLVNGKIYIGFTSRSFQERWREHVRDSKCDTPPTVLSRAIKKYGMHNFKHEVVQDGLSKKRRS